MIISLSIKRHRNLQTVYFFRVQTTVILVSGRMSPSRIKGVEVTAPSKVILHGEHAVVYGKTAVAAALDLRTKLTIQPLEEEKLTVQFPDLGLSHSWSLDELK